jgi:hypothetical protein
MGRANSLLHIYFHPSPEKMRKSSCRTLPQYRFGYSLKIDLAFVLRRKGTDPHTWLCKVNDYKIKPVRRNVAERITVWA